MKYLLVIAVVVIVLYLLRTKAHGDAPRSPQARAPQGEPQDMIECPVCSVHLPRTDALPGPGGRLYCCADHVRRGEA
jgi:uncharacterized protein